MDPNANTQGVLDYIRVEPDTFQRTVAFIRNVERLPRGTTLGVCSDILLDLRRSQTVMVQAEPPPPPAKIEDVPPPAGHVVEVDPPANDERHPSEELGELPPAKLANENEESS